MKQGVILACAALIFRLCLGSPQPVYANAGAVLGIHILSPSEAPQARELLRGAGLPDEWHYVTIPLTLNDLTKKSDWQTFFDYARDQKLIPIIRLSTKAENGAWAIPTRKNVVDLMNFLSSLNWPTHDRYVIVFNEVNHAQEWGNSLDPAAYADILAFTSNWAKSENLNYQILPAAMDLAADNSAGTEEAFHYLDRMVQANSQIFRYVDYWNSHSYPNPGFSASPQQTGKQSLRGYQTELAYVKEKSGQDLKTFITETGWLDSNAVRRWLPNYYLYAAQNIWNDDRIMGVTPFVLEGAPGPFTNFTFLDANGNPTAQYHAYQDAMKSISIK